VQHFADKEPASFTLERAFDWTNVRVVKSAKAYFHKAPDASKKQRAYVVEGNAVGVRATRGGFVQAEYVGASGKTTTGWLRADDLYAVP
jgi:hypothetical protein